MNLQTLLVLTPYEGPNKNAISPEEFSEKLLCETGSFIQLGCQIMDELKDNYSIRFLSGFPGSGKTTFLNWLKYIINNPTSEFTKKLFGKNEQLRKIIESKKDAIASILNFSFKNKGNRSQVKNLFVDTIKDSYLEFKETFEFLSTNEEEIDEFISAEFNRFANIDISKTTEKRKIKEILLETNIEDDQVILFFLIHKSYSAKSKGKTNSLCLIDNIDALKPNLIYGKFWDDFTDAYQRFCQISDSFKEKLLHWSNLEVIFSLRNYNFSRINFDGHDFDQIEQQINKIPYLLIFEDDDVSENLKHILLKRLDYYKNQSEKDHSADENLEFLVNILIQEDSLYREKFYMPLFNYDIRHFSQEIHEMVSRKNTFIFDKEKYELLFADETTTRVGARGILIHNLIKTLFLSQRKYPVDQIIKEEGNSFSQQNRNAKFCSISRVLLTTMYNLTYGDNPLNSDLNEINDPTKRDYFSYADLISEIRVSTNNSIVRTLLDSINMNFAQLISRLEVFHGINNESIIHFMDAEGIEVEFNDKKKLIFKDKDKLLAAETIPTNLISVDDDFSSFRMQINPSAIVYLRYLVVHFEYFAAHCYWKNERKFEKPFSPLYIATNKIIGTNKFEFEELLENVFNLVKSKKYVNDNLIRDLIKSGNKWSNNWQNIDTLLKSNLIFQQDNGDGKKGSLYSSRVITTHLPYIENFRHHLNNNIGFTNIEEMERINKFILKILLKYVNLYKNTDRKIRDPRQGVAKAIEDWEKEINLRLNEEIPLTQLISL